MRSSIEPQGTIAIERSRVADYLTLTKPELTFLSVVTALGGLYLAADGIVPIVLMIHTLVGTALVGGGAGALNQYIEREYDALMKRTENRPLPSGRLGPMEVLIFGILVSVAGMALLLVFVNTLTSLLAGITLVTYLFLYTPLKRITPFSTVIGGIPGALPPVMGWTAVRGEISLEAGTLFLILFVWQMPHFFSLAWMYRKDYERAGYPMLTVKDPEGATTSGQILIYCSTLIPASLMLTLVAGLGAAYLIGATVAGSIFLASAIHLYRARTNLSARRVFFVSLLYLPALLCSMVIDKL